MTAARLASLITAAAIAAAMFEPFYFRIYAIDRARYAAALTELPYRRLPGLRRFLDDVRARTVDGDVIVMLHAPAPDAEGFDYVLPRAMYRLAGRDVLPALGSRGELLREHFARAGYVACYRAEPALPGFATVWRSGDGVLMRKAR